MGYSVSRIYVCVSINQKYLILNDLICLLLKEELVWSQDIVKDKIHSLPQVVFSGTKRDENMGENWEWPWMIRLKDLNGIKKRMFERNWEFFF